VEAMGFGNCVIVNGTPENIEVVGDAAVVYKKNDVDDLVSKIRQVLAEPTLVQNYQQKAPERIRQLYSWESITEDYENLFLSLLSAQKGHE
jgi:glycosyltransferase involved in cell wall biosynthesis